MRAEPFLLSLEVAPCFTVCDLTLEKEQHVRNAKADVRFCGINPCSSKPGPGSPNIVWIFKQLCYNSRLPFTALENNLN